MTSAETSSGILPEACAALQIRILDADGHALTVSQLSNQGVIELIGDTRWPADWPRPAGGTPHYQDWNSSPSE
jgi:hypothetical protein